MRHDVFFAGFGGQGVLLAGNVLALMALEEGKNVSFFPAYGVEKRGGSAVCTVVIAQGDVGSPVVGSPSVVVALNQSSYDKYAGKIGPGGTCIINASLVEPSGSVRPDIHLISVPMNRLALDLGDSRMVNMIALGVYVSVSAAVSISTISKALAKALPERSHSLIPANIKAAEAGANFITASS